MKEELGDSGSFRICEVGERGLIKTTNAAFH